MRLLFAARWKNALQYPDAINLKLKVNAVSVESKRVLGKGRYGTANQKLAYHGNHEEQGYALLRKSHRSNELELSRA